MNEAMARDYTPAERAYVLKQWEELQPEIEKMRKLWKELQVWSEEHMIDISKCRMHSRLAGNE